MMQHQDRNDDSINILESLRIIASYRKMIIGATCAVGLLSLIYSLTLPNIYSATAKILPTQQNQNVMSTIMGQMGALANFAGGMLGSGSNSDLYVEMLKSDDIIDAIVTRFKLTEVYKKKLRQDAYKELMKNVSIRTGKEGVVSITVDDKDPQRAADLANALVEELDKLSAKVNMAQAGQSRAFLENRLAKAKQDLAEAEDKLKDFQLKNKALNVPDQAKVTIEGVSQLMAQQASLEVQLATLQRQFTDSSQEVKNVKASITNIKKQIAQLEGGTGGSIPSIGFLPTLGQEYVRRMRDFKSQEAIVGLLVNQHEMAKLSEANNISSIQVVQHARVPERKSKPKRSQIVAVVVFATFSLSIIASFVLAGFKRLPEEEQGQWCAVLKQMVSFR